ncbi:MAG: AAA family ATPase [Lachnospiraceae bacterium]|nr:AAA family ATPase [Lachnospiraceae bacterium]
MYRKYEEKIQNWIDTEKKALLIYGARQVGKTYLIRKVLNKNKISFCEFNLIERSDIREFLMSAKDTTDISSQLALYSEVPLKEHESIIFLDEIQRYPDIVTKIKFLADEGRYRYILSGSNLGVELKGIRSMPVGYVDMWQMAPMTFDEFALASGITETMIEHYRECFRKQTPVDPIIHEKLLKAFYYYLIVGGMPAVVREYNESHSIERIDAEQKAIINQYKADFTRYEADNRRLKVISVYDNIPAQLNKQNRKFNFTLLDKELKFDRYEESFLWLKDAAVAIPSYIVAAPEQPLQMSRATNVFKLFLNDVGLLTSCYPMSVKKQLLEMNPDNVINNGSLFENFVAEEIFAAGLLPYYYKKNGVGEVDFIIERDDKPIPIEVKSGKDYKKHKALDHLLEKYTFDEVYVLSANNVEIEGNILYYPIYMAGALCECEKLVSDHIPSL